jgi:hypothetical protein
MVIEVFSSPATENERHKEDDMTTHSLTHWTSGARSTRSAIGADRPDSAIGALDSHSENCGAKLTEAAYPVMLRHGTVDNWLDLKLDLWKILTEIVKQSKQSTINVAPVGS